MNNSDEQILRNSENDTGNLISAAEDSPNRLSLALQEDFDVWKALGGVRGLIESVLPVCVFMIVYFVSGNIIYSFSAPLILGIIFIVVRFFSGIDVMPAVSGFIVLCLSAFWVGKTGRAESFFVLGLWLNLLYASVLVVSLIVKWPLIGVLFSLLQNSGFAWQKREKRADVSLYKRYFVMTLIWVCLFILRLMVEGPLYYFHLLGALGVARIALGPFAFMLTLWLTWIFARPLLAKKNGQ
ncbi:MAG: DUF3159 domain-containing protein [Actinomycetaceae bacterium]|nr:DUF3159 domain-containing protein [Actinomycetaceae bacterium]